MRQKDLLLKAQSGEFEQLRSQAIDLSAQLREIEGAKKRAEDLLEDELKKKKQILEASESASKAEENRLSEKIRALEVQAADRERVVKGRESDLANFVINSPISTPASKARSVRSRNSLNRRKEAAGWRRHRQRVRTSADCESSGPEL